MAWLKRAGIVVGAIVGAALAIVLIATALLYTSWGQEQVRAYAEDQLDGYVEGDVTILATAFGLDGTIRVEGLVVTQAGQRVASVGAVATKLDLTQIIHGRVVADEVTIDDLFLDTRAQLLPKDEEDEEDDDEPEEDAGDGGGDAVQIGRFVVTNARVIVEDRGAPRTIDGIDAVVTWRGDEIAVAGARATVDGVEVSEAMAAANLDTGALSGFGRVAGKGAAVAALAGEPRWRGDADVEVAAVRDADGATWRVTAAGTIGGADVAVVAVADPDRRAATLRLRAAGAVPGAVWEGAPDQRFDVTARLGDGVTPIAVETEPLDVLVAGRGGVEGIELSRFEIGAVGTRDDAEVWVDARTPRGPIDARVRGRMPGDIETAHVDDASLSGDITAVVALIDTAPRMGAVTVSVRGSGPITALNLTGDVDIRNLRDGSTRVRHTTGRIGVRSLSALDVSEPMRGTLDLTLRGVDESGRPIEYVRANGTFRDGGDWFDLGVVARGMMFADELRGEVEVTRSPTTTALAFGEVVIETGTLTWRGVGGRVAIAGSGRVQVDDVELTSPAGKLQVDGVLQPRRRKEAEGALKIRAEEISLERAAPTLAFFGVTDPLSGTVSARLDLSRRSRDLDVEGRVVYDAVAWSPDAPAVTGNLDIDLGGRELLLKGEVQRAGGTGSATWLVQTRAPASTADVDAWRALDIDDIVESRVTVRDVDAALVESVMGEPLGATGLAEADIVFPHNGKRELGLDLRVTGVSYGEVTGVDATFNGAWNARDLSGTVSLHHDHRPVIVAEVGARVGVQDVWRLPAAELMDRPITASAVIRDFDLRRIERAKLTTQPLIGKFSGNINVSGTARNPRASLERGTIVGLRAAGVPFQRVRIDLAYADRELRADLRADQSAGGSIAIVDAVYDLRDGKMAGNVKSVSFDLQVLRVFATDNVDPLSIVGGKLDADLHVAGPPDAPEINGTVGIRNGQLLIEGGSRKLEDITVAVELRGDHALIQKLSARTGDGSASATGQIDFSARTLDLDVVAEKVPVIAGAFVAAVDLDGTLSVRQTDERFVAQANIFEGQVTLSDTGRELQSIGSLEDVVIVEHIGDDAPRRKGGGGGGDGALDRFSLNLVIVNPEGIRVKSRELDARITGDLAIEYDGQLSAVTGGFEARSGTVVLFDERYAIVDAWADFDGAVPINPDIYVELRRTFPSATVTIIAQGTVDDTTIAFSSDVPDYDEPQIISIMLGQDPDDTSISETTPQDRAGRVALNLILAQTREELGLPIDVVRTYDDGFEFGKWLSDRMLLGYRYRSVSDDNENSQEIRLEYRILRNLVFEGTAGNQDVHGADLLYILRF